MLEGVLCSTYSLKASTTSVRSKVVIEKLPYLKSTITNYHTLASISES